MNERKAKLGEVGRSILRLLRTGSGSVVVDAGESCGYALAGSNPLPEGTREETMPTGPPADITQLLAAWRGGDRGALEQLTPLVYDELRRLANRYLRGERRDHTLQGTALVHEAYIRLLGHNNQDWQSRAHFFGVAARLMREILVDHARRHSAAKRGSGKPPVSLTEAAIFSVERASELVALDDALQELSRLDPERSRIVELRYFGGLSIEEIGEVEHVSIATVRRRLRMAEAWLHRELNKA